MNKDNKIFRVLSIDFDYFQNATKDALFQYPDGIDLHPSISQQVWESKYLYKQTADLLKTVTCKVHEVYTLESVLCNNCNSDVPVLACFSHEYIYGFIQEQFSDSGAEKLEIVNVDFHPDYYNDNVKYGTPDCGNWCYFIKKDFPDAKITWIAPKNYEELYSKEQIEEIDCITTDIKALAQFKYDAIFLCRSDNWLPPHLDMYFLQLLSFINTFFTNGKIQKIITQLRDYPKEPMLGFSTDIESELALLKSFE